MSLLPIRRDAILAVEPNEALGALRRYVGSHTQLAVRARCPLPALRTEIELVRDVVVTVEHGGADDYGVQWSPGDAGVFPRFSGTLCIVGANESAILRLDGAYDDVTETRPDPVDAEIGFRLVHATARALLTALARALTGG